MLLTSNNQEIINAITEGIKEGEREGAKIFIQSLFKPPMLYITIAIIVLPIVELIVTIRKKKK